MDEIIVEIIHKNQKPWKGGIIIICEMVKNKTPTNFRMGYQIPLICTGQQETIKLNCHLFLWISALNHFQSFLAL